MVRIGSARINEKGTVNGGKAGDQTRNEVGIQNYYLHKKGWIVIRAKSASHREKIAHNMESACNNNNIGYCQNHRTSLTSASRPYGYDAAKVKVKCEVDCSELVRNCCLYAGIKVGIFNTASEVSALVKTGKFQVFTSLSMPEDLLRGDILVTATKGHTVVVLDNGENTTEGTAKVETVHVVRAGENLTKISKKYGTTPAKIVADNIGKYPRITKSYIQVGWKLAIK